MKDSAAAPKYARALFAQAQATNQILACQQGLEEVARIARARKALMEILTHPFVSTDEKKSVLHSVLGEYATPLLERFLMLLVEKHRFPLIFEIVAEFQEAVDRQQNIQPLKVKVAYPMSDAQQKTLQQKLEGWLKSKVRMDVQVDPQIIGGIVIQTRDKVSDQSLRTQLRRLQQVLIS